MNLTGTVTAAHIHGPASQTAAAGVLFSLGGATPGFNSSGTNGGWTNTTVNVSTQEANLLGGLLYLNAHTAVNSGGEIRGNLVPIPEPTSAALLGAAGLVFLARRRRS